MKEGLSGRPGGCWCCGCPTEKDENSNKNNGDRVESGMHVRVSRLNTDRRAEKIN